MTVCDEDTGVTHRLKSWDEYKETLKRLKREFPDVRPQYGAHEFTVETMCGLTIRVVGCSLEPVTCIGIGCLPCT